ncbi:MAG: hypothetical protein K2Y25_09340 [Pseudomonadaceae bacterium]|nr:hypothetical protein [Pseudomonadaceae bacterium]
MANHKIGPWPLGLDNTSQDTGMPAGSLRVAVNVLVDIDGTVDTAPGKRLLVAHAGAHSLWTSESGASLCGIGGALYQASTSSLDLLADLGAEAPFAFCDLNGRVMVGTRLGLHALADGVVVAAAQPTPSCSVSVAAIGGLPAGRYGVAISVWRGDEESGLSRMLMLDVPEGHGIQVAIPSGEHDSVAIYRTEANGGDLYRAATAPESAGTFLVGVGQLGGMPDTRHLDQLPGGHIVAPWKGRLLVARGRTLMHSSPLRYGLYDSRHNFTQFASRLRMVLPVDDGVYVADSHSCYFLAGTDPEQWVVRKLDASPPAYGASAVVDGNLFTDGPPTKVAVWLSGKGFVLGLPEGLLAQPQAKRLALPQRGNGSLAVFNRRLFALTY